MPTKDGKGDVDNYRSYHTTSIGRFCYRGHIRFPNHTRVYRKPDSTLETKQKKEKFRFPSIVIILFSASACTLLIGLSLVSYILTFLGFAVIIFAFAYWLIKPHKNPY